MKRRKFVPGTPNHIYQRSRNGSVIFYSLEDCLVYFTVFCTCAKWFGLTVLGLCEMYDHIHQLVVAQDLPMLSEFERMVNMKFSYEYYDDLKRGVKSLVSDFDRRNRVNLDSAGYTIPNIGHLFQSPFGSAPKIGSKKIRTSIAYLYNNPVERNIHPEAIKWRWNFLAYAFSDHPFSERMLRRDASTKLRKDLKEVEGCYARGSHLRYAQLRRMFDGLSPDEKNQLVDFIIVAYNVIEYDRLSSYYGSLEKMLLAINSNTGSEYDIKEERHHNTDSSYGQMMNYVVRHDYVSRAKDVLLLPTKEKDALVRILVRDTMADEWQALKFLGMDFPSR